MTPQQLLGTAVRLFAIWLVLTALAYFASLFTGTANTGGRAATISAYAVSGAYVFVAVLLWLFPMAVACRILPHGGHDDHISLQGFELARVGCALLGLWLLSKALSGLVTYLLLAMLMSDGNSLSDALLSALIVVKADVGIAAGNLLLSLALIFKARSFAQLIIKN